MDKLALIAVVVLVAACGAEQSEPPSELQGAPIEAPADSWTWIDFPEAVCANGAATGLGVNLTDRSGDLFVYFMGGGACWDKHSCFDLRTAVNTESGYDAAMFAKEAKLDAGSFDRSDPTNPFRDMSFVFVPYCTGDVHAGNHVATYEVDGQTRQVHHRGAANAQAFLYRLAPTFPDAERVFVAGSSAGGYGAQLNFHRFVAAFPDAELHVLSDSAPLVQPEGSRFDDWNEVWGAASTAPPDCSACADGFPQWFDYLTSTYPESRFGLLSHDNDQIIRLFFGYPPGGGFRETMAAFVARHVAPAPGAEAYIVEGGQHVLLVDVLGGDEDTDETSISEWMTSWVDGDDWKSVVP